VDWAREAGLAATTDPAGNLFLRLEGICAEAAPVLTGSHLDSQPSGRKFDGVFGVLGGLEAAQAIRTAGITLRRRWTSSRPRATTHASCMRCARRA
jgi:N-carbamoyl-L-amino-acid hydrolase